MFKICIDCLSQKKFNDKEFREIDEALCGKIKGGEINLLISGSKKEVMAKIKELAEEEKTKDDEMLETVNGIWEAYDLKEKIYALEKMGHELDFS